MKISPNYYNSPKKPFFGGIHENNIQSFSDNPKRMLCHTSLFFRYAPIDEHIIEYLSRQFNNEPLSLLSLGCSEGEEVYSLAMMLDAKKIPAEIRGMDVDYLTVEKAKRGFYQLTENEKNYLFLEKPNTKEQAQHQQSFKKFFEKVDGLYDPKISATNEFYKKDKCAFQNCSFEQGDILNFRNKFPRGYFNALFLRNVMYHLFENDNDLRNTIIANRIIGELQNTIKPNGLIVFAPFEVHDENDVLNRALLRYGFKNMHEKYDTVWLNAKMRY